MYQFTEDCLTGIQEIDEEHRQLFKMINEAFEMLKEENSAAAGVKNMIAALKQYAAVHFAHEEAYMEKINDPELPRQKKEHAAFAERINQFDMEAGGGAAGKKLLSELLEYLSRWLYCHILGSDIMIGKMTAMKAEENPFAFTEKYKTGIDLIDDEHRRLFEIIEDINHVIHAEYLHDKYDEIMRIVTNLKEYTILHFKDEEEYMERIRYQALPAQRHAHQVFIDQLNEINLEEIDNNQQEYLKDLIEYLLGWLANHILKMDKKIPKEE